VLDGGGGDVYRVLVGKPEGKRPVGETQENIKMDLREVGCGGVVWIVLAQDRDRWRALVNVVRTLGFHKIRGIS
jgi:hypothetical protein